MDLREFLIAPVAYLSPEKTLAGLDSALAERRVERASHSIADVVAHLAFWQDWFHQRCTGEPAPMIASAALGWPRVDDGSWPSVHARFIDGLHRLGGLAADDVRRCVEPPIEFPPLAHYTVADALVHVATHNAHHLGQVIVLRQLLGSWPSPYGSWTW